MRAHQLNGFVKGAQAMAFDHTVNVVFLMQAPSSALRSSIAFGLKESTCKTAFPVRG